MSIGVVAAGIGAAVGAVELLSLLYEQGKRIYYDIEKSKENRQRRIEIARLAYELKRRRDVYGEEAYRKLLEENRYRIREWGIDIVREVGKYDTNLANDLYSKINEFSRSTSRSPTYGKNTASATAIAALAFFAFIGLLNFSYPSNKMTGYSVAPSITSIFGLFITFVLIFLGTWLLFKSKNY